jgi:hypothetical protein
VKRLAVLVVVLVIGVEAPASGSVLLTEDGSSRAQPFQRWADRAGVPTAAEQVHVHLAACPLATWAPACTWAGAHAIYFRPGAAMRVDFVHELGHRFDYRMPDWARRAFLRLTRDPRPWRSPGGSPHERFADAYSVCARSPRRVPRRFLSSFGYAPSRWQHRAVCRLISRVGQRTPGAYDPPYAWKLRR